MECKAYDDHEAADDSGCINRNIVECKVLHSNVVDPHPVLVLIETLWNVKTDT